MNQKYRGLYFLGATLGVGLIIIALMKLMSFDPISNNGSKPISIMTTGGHNVLENKIKELAVSNVTPQQYNNLLIEINTGASQNLFNQAIKDMLLRQLNESYRDLCGEKIKTLLQADPIKKEQVYNLVSHLQSTFGSNKELTAIKDKLKALDYYTQILPQKVTAFINQGFADFDNNQYKILINELEKMPNLDQNLKNKKSIISVRNSGVGRLQLFYKNYTNWSSAMAS